MTSTLPHPARKPRPHVFQMPVVTEIPRPAETAASAGTWEAIRRLCHWWQPRSAS